MQENWGFEVAILAQQIHLKADQMSFFLLWKNTDPLRITQAEIKVDCNELGNWCEETCHRLDVGAQPSRLPVAARKVLGAYYGRWQGNKCPLQDILVKSWQGHQLQVILVSNKV